MRPLHLELTAFGPYPATQAIDFEALGSSDLFLIHGPTGSGKTSIFDGLTYALFGALAGSRRVDRIRADRAARDLATRVVLRFRMGDEVFRVERSPEWERPKKKGQGTTTEQATALLVREGEEKAIATGASNVTTAMERILGMKVEQFTQVALLPQGEFRRLLLAESKDREPLLRQLFGSDRFVEIEEWLRERKRKLHEERDTLVTRRSEALGGVEPGEVEAKLQERRVAIEAARERLGDARARDEAAVTALSDGRSLAERFATLDRALKAEASTRSGAEAAGQDRTKLERARRAEHVRGLLDGARTASVEDGRRASEEQATVEVEARARAAHADAQRVLAVTEGEGPEREAIRARITRLEGALPGVALLANRTAAAQEARRRLAGATDARDGAAKEADGAIRERDRLVALREEQRPIAELLANRAVEFRALAEALGIARERETLSGKGAEVRKALDEAERAVLHAREAADGAAARARSLHQQREDRLAASIARSALQDGKPCPVCGSTHHPSPATAEGHVPLEGDVAEARNEAERLARLAGDAATARERVEAQLAAIQGQLEQAIARESRSVKELEAGNARAERALTASREAATQVSTLEDRIRKAEAALDGARARREQAQQGVSTVEADLAKVEAAREELARQLAAAGAGPDSGEELSRLRTDLAAREARARQAAERSATAQGALGRAETARVLAARHHAEASAALAEAGAAAAAACAVHGFTGLEDCEAALLPQADQERLQSSVEQRVTDHGAALRALQEAEVALDGAARPDVASLESARRQTERAAGIARDEQTRLEEEAGRLVEILQRAADLHAGTVEVERKLAVEGHVADLVAGRNDRGMSLNRFVLAARLEEVAEAASERLLLMTKGRFRLRHDDSLARKNSAAGLSLVVEDTWTGTLDRPVGALSGGESFLASLSLALGLSDVVLRHSGGRRLDALFIDEGFGTLDESTLDDAIQALETLRQSGRMVGIISHVPELKRRIQARIEVATTETGAVAKVRAG